MRWSTRPSSTSPGRPRATAQLLPARIYDDGKATFLTWPAGTPLPAILVKDHEGNEGPVNFAVRGETIVVDGVPRELVLRSGEDTRHADQPAARSRAPAPAACPELAQAGPSRHHGGEVMKLAMRLPEKSQRAAADGDPRDERDDRSDRPRQPHRLPGGRAAQGPLRRARARRGRRLRRAARRRDAVGPQRLAHGRRAEPRGAGPAAPRRRRRSSRRRRRRAAGRGRRRPDAGRRPIPRRRRCSPRRRCVAAMPAANPYASPTVVFDASALPLPAPAAAAATAALRPPSRPATARATSPAASAASAAAPATATSNFDPDDHRHPGDDDPGGARDRDQHRRARLCPRGRQPGRAQLRRHAASWCRAARG